MYNEKDGLKRIRDIIDNAHYLEKDKVIRISEVLNIILVTGEILEKTNK